MEEGRTGHLRARLPPEKLDAYKAAAAAEGRTLTNWIEWHLDAVCGLRVTMAKPKRRGR